MTDELRATARRTEDIFTWSPWRPLLDSWKDEAIPAHPGLYRIRRKGRGDVDYIGQTGAGGMMLRRRLAMLRGVYGEVMPYRDPHTAAPALWALRHSLDCEFEVSVAPIVGSTPWRKGCEAVAISLHRQVHGQSPTANFGRMPAGYRISSYRGGEARGGPDDEQLAHHQPGIPPVGLIDGDPLALDWCRHCWTSWQTAAATLAHLPITTIGLYRLRGVGNTALLYIGQGQIGAGLRIICGR